MFDLPLIFLLEVPEIILDGAHQRTQTLHDVQLALSRRSLYGFTPFYPDLKVGDNLSHPTLQQYAVFFLSKEYLLLTVANRLNGPSHFFLPDVGARANPRMTGGRQREHRMETMGGQYHHAGLFGYPDEQLLCVRDHKLHLLEGFVRVVGIIPD